MASPTARGRTARRPTGRIRAIFVGAGTAGFLCGGRPGGQRFRPGGGAGEAGAASGGGQDGAIQSLPGAGASAGGHRRPAFIDVGGPKAGGTVGVDRRRCEGAPTPHLSSASINVEPAGAGRRPFGSRRCRLARPGGGGATSSTAVAVFTINARPPIPAVFRVWQRDGVVERRPPLTPRATEVGRLAISAGLRVLPDGGHGATKGTAVAVDTRVAPFFWGGRPRGGPSIAAPALIAIHSLSRLGGDPLITRHAR